MEVVSPSTLWQPESSWSRSDAAKTCMAGMAACVSIARQRWIRAVVREWRRMAGAWRTFVEAKSLRKVAASSLQRGGIAGPGAVLLFLLASLEAVPRYCPPRIRGWPARVRRKPRWCQPPHGGTPLAMTSIRLPSWVLT